MTDKSEKRVALSAFGLTFGFSVAITLIQYAFLASDLYESLGGQQSVSAISVVLNGAAMRNFLWPVALFIGLNAFISLASVFLANQLPGRKRLKAWSLPILAFVWATILWENTRIYPASEFALPLHLPLVLQSISAWYLWMIALLFLAVRHIRTHRRVSIADVILLLPGPVFLIGPLLAGQMDNVSPLTATRKPNVILIGMDSLRIDVTGGIGAESDLVPQMSEWLARGAVFPTTYTPVARTYPSWMSILSGQYPVHSGARVNLMSSASLDLQDLMPAFFKANGYRTVYAMDERRFSNIDESYGFERIVGPQMGVKDFLATLYDDFPVTNVLAASSARRYLMPQHYANRALPLTYRPADFDGQLTAILSEEAQRPLFMVAHFCLPHWPYFWETTERNAGKAGLQNMQEGYVRAIRRADRQLGDLMHELQEKGYLRNALVVLLSDHGEALGLDQDTPYEIEGETSSYRYYGHGYDLMSPIQNRVVLGILGFGDMASAVKPGRHEGTAVLIDIAPTIARLLAVEFPWKVDGQSLADVISGTASIGKRPVFMETELDLYDMGKSLPNMAKLIEGGAGLYQLTDAGRLELTSQALQSVIKSKKRAVIHDGYLLEVSPKESGAEIVLGNQATLKAEKPSWRKCIVSQPCASLLSLLQTEYGAEFDAINFSEDQNE